MFGDRKSRGRRPQEGVAPLEARNQRCHASSRGPAFSTHVPRPRSRTPQMSTRTAQRSGIQSISPAIPCGCALLDRSSKNHLCRLADAVRSAMVSINSHEERTAVRVPEPRRDGRNIHPGFDGGGGEGIAKIMMRQQLDAELLAGPGEGLPGLSHGQDLAFGVNLRNSVNGHADGVLVAGVEFLQERSRRRYQRNLAVG